MIRRIRVLEGRSMREATRPSGFGGFMDAATILCRLSWTALNGGELEIHVPVTKAV